MCEQLKQDGDLEGVRRWFYGGTPPPGEEEPLVHSAPPGFTCPRSGPGVGVQAVESASEVAEADPHYA